jgi:hypothetical protein
VKGVKGGREGESLSGMAVQEIGGSMKRLNPVRRWSTSLNQKGAYDVVGGTDNTLGLTVLWGSVRARHPKEHAMREEKRASGRIVEFTTVVTLNALNCGAKLCGDISKKVSKSSKSVGFLAQWEGPQIVRAVIKNN